MANKKNVAKQASPLLDDQEPAEFSLKVKCRKTAGGTIEQELITPWVLENNETTELQVSQISTPYNEERPGLHASSLGLEESIGGSLSATSASHSSWIDTKRGVSREESSSYATFAGSFSYRFQSQTIHSAPTSQFLGMKNCQVATQEKVSGDTETVYTRSVEHQGCSDVGGMQNLRTRSHVDFQSAHYNQSLDQSSWVNNTLEASRQNFNGLSINEPVADTQSDKALGVINYLDSINCMHQEMENGLVGNQISGIQPTTQDLQGIYENYGNSSSHNIGKVQRDARFRHSVEPYQKLSKKARELLKKKQIQEQLDFVDQFHGPCPKLVHAPTFSSIQEEENSTPLSPKWPGK